MIKELMPELQDKFLVSPPDKYKAEMKSIRRAFKLAEMNISKFICKCAIKEFEEGGWAKKLEEESDGE